MHIGAKASVLRYLMMDPRSFHAHCVVSTFCLSHLFEVLGEDLDAFFTLRAAEESECLVCSLRTYLAQTLFFFHSCNHVFVSFASSAQGKLLSWQHLSLRIMETVTGEKGF